MKLTKYEHACFTLEKEGKILIVDPGEWTRDLVHLEDIVGIVITHGHPDHVDTSALEAFVARNPQATIYAHMSVIEQLSSDLPTQTIAAGESVDVNPFKLEIFGSEHAVIHADIPVIANIGLLIDESLYYPGDSFVAPGKAVSTLALPVSAPWLKIAEVIDFARLIDAGLIFPTHDAILSDTGKAVVDRIISAQVPNSRYIRLQEPLEV